MTERRVVAVCGATGAQGGGLVRAIVNDPQGGFAARAITRDAGSAKARELAATNGIHLALGFAERRGERVFNTVALISPRGELIRTATPPPLSASQISPA